MKLFKTFNLSVLAALIAMAFLAAPSATATPTVCATHEDPCGAGNQLSFLHLGLTSGNVWKLVGKNPGVTVLCLGVLIDSVLLALGATQQIHGTKVTYSGCGTSASHNECTVTATKLPLLALSKTSLNKGTVELTAGKTYVKCTGAVKIDCEYEDSGLKFDVEGKTGSNGHGMVDAGGTALGETSGSLCPETSEIAEGLLEPSTDTYVVDKGGGGGGGNTQLCNTANDPCNSGASSVHLDLAAGHVGKLETDLATILCLTVLAEATPLGLANPQSIHTTALEFTECGTTSAHENCEVTVTELPLFNLKKTGSNEGDLIGQSGKVSVVCEDVFFSVDIECEYDVTGLEFMSVGAGGATGNGMVNAAGIVPEEIGSDFLCPNTPEVTEGLLEPSAARYISS